MKIHRSLIENPVSDRRRWLTLVVVCFGQLMIMVDATIVNVALPSIQRDLHFTPATLTWVVNAYLITYGSFLLLAGRAGDLIGRKKVFLAGLVVFTVASVLSGLTTDEVMLVAARALQGLGAALSGGVIIALIVTDFPKPQERAQAMSIFTLVIAGGGSFGLLAGGLLTQMINWHWIFFINLPIGLATLILGWWLINENETRGLSRDVDIAGSILVSVAMMVGVYAIVTASDQGWASAHTLGFGAAAVLLLFAFIVLEARIKNPIMPLRILRLRSLTGASAARALLASGGFTAYFLGALYLQHVKGYDAIGTGLAFLPQTVALGILSLGITARLMRSFGPRAIVVPGMLIFAAGMLVLSTLDAHSSYFPGIFGGYLLFGIGAGMSFMPLITIAMAEVPVAEAGLASGIANVTMQVTAAIGLAVLSTIATDHAKALVAQGQPLVSALAGGYQLGFLLAAACIAVGLLVVLVALRVPVAAVQQVHVRSEFTAVEAEAA
ncbi:MAG TPA: MFS transporter [Candidatus Nitrosotalea sp.]|nr:MFS transporter [Candidatus Nitrosotalea sp.]